MWLDFSDESLTGCLNEIISGLLPHENYHEEDFSLLYPTLKTVLDTKNTRGLYYIFYTVFDKYMALSASLPRGKFHVNITRKRFSDALESNLPDLILDSKTDVSGLMAAEGKSADINIPTVQQEVMGTVYEKAMALYEECFEMAQTYDDAMSKMVSLKDIIKANVIESGLGAQRTIMSTGLKVGRKNYFGPDGWLRYVNDLSRIVSEMEKSSEGDLECNGIDVARGVDEANEELSTPLATYGIPQLDDATPILKHRLMVMVAQENTGKTQVCIHLIAKLIRAGVKPFYACGEAVANEMLNKIIASYIYQEYGMFFEAKFLYGEGYKSLSPDEMQVVNTAKARVMSSGLVISTNTSYDNFVGKVQHYYHRGCEAFFVDHTQSLKGRNGRPIGELVTNLALDSRELKRDLPIFICLTSQPSSSLKDLFQKSDAKELHISPTAQSAAPSQEADELFILHETEYLKMQGLLCWTTYKRRGAAKPKPFYILKHFNVSAFEYDPRYQGVDSVDEGTLDGLIRDISSVDDDSDDDDMEIVF